MISWSECHIDWADVTNISKITHIPTGVFIEPIPEQADGDKREELLKSLDVHVTEYRVDHP